MHPHPLQAAKAKGETRLGRKQVGATGEDKRRVHPKNPGDE